MRGYRALILAAWMLIGSAGMTAQAAPTATPQAALNGLSRGDEVVLVQSRLRDLGYYNYKITGQYGHVTEEAVSAFQKQNGLDDDGTVGGETMKRLFSNDAKRLLFNARKPIPTPTPVPTPVPTKKPTPKPTDKPETKKTKAAATPTGKKATAEPTKKNTKSEDSDDKKATKTPKVTATPKPKATKAPAVKSDPEYVAPKEAAPGYGRMADWKEVNSIWGRGETVTVKDLRTGLQYRMYRMGGTNHADVEPASYDDCMTFKRTYGGSFSWDRRPVLVKINGEWIAGSTNGMPHGKQTISGNGMDGQVCIHFLNSRTHNHNAKDKDHMNCVKEAAGM